MSKNTTRCFIQLVWVFIIAALIAHDDRTENVVGSFISNDNNSNPFCNSSGIPVNEKLCALSDREILDFTLQDALNFIFSLRSECRSNIANASMNEKQISKPNERMISAPSGLEANHTNINMFVGDLSDLKTFEYQENLIDELNDTEIWESCNMSAEAVRDNRRFFPDPYDALIGIYSSTNGEYWNVSTNWGDRSICHCMWHGVNCMPCDTTSCQAMQCPIVALNLASNNISGNFHAIQPFLSQLPYLSYLVMNDNHLTGSINEFTNQGLMAVVLHNNQLTGNLPSFSGNLGVESISLYGNRLTGVIPDYVLPKLKQLALHENQLEGSIPSLKQCPSLQVISLFGNKLTGTIPDFALPGLGQLALHENQLEGTLPSFQNCPSLQVISVHDNWLSGVIPTFSQGFLTVISAHVNRFRGDIPDFNLPYLKILVLGNNTLNGVLPAFSKCPMLETISMEHNQIYGTLPTFGSSRLVNVVLNYNRIGGSLSENMTYPFLQNFIMSSNQISGSLPKLTNLASLIVLDLADNYISGALPDRIGGSYLSVLMLTGNKISGTIPEFSNNPYLRVLMLSNNPLEGTIPSFSNLHQLRVVMIGACKVNGTLPSFENNPYLEVISIHQTPIQGTLPNYQNLPNLQNLIIYETGVGGSIPNFDLPNLERLYLLRSNYDGELPKFNKVPKLKELYLIFCRLTGTLPDFEHIPQLRQLYIGETDIHGTIPDFRHMSNLESLYLLSNKLNGTLPDFRYLPRLESIRAYGNDLVGTIPDFKNLRNLKLLSIYQTRLQGTLPNFSNTPNLREIEVQDTKIGGPLPLFDKCPLLSRLYSYGNNHNGSIPSWELPHLAYFDVSDNHLTGQLPSFLGMSSLQSVIFKNNNISGILPHSLSNLTSLREFIAGRNQLFGALPKNFLQIPSLITVDLSYNRFQEQMATFIAAEAREDQVTSLFILNLEGNKITGPLTYYVPFFLHKAQTVNLANNQLLSLDDLPIFSNWKNLNLSGNPLTGVIPDSYKNFYLLESLDVSGTNLRSVSSDQKLPSFLIGSATFQKSDVKDDFFCPRIVGGSSATLRVEMEPKYHNYTLCECLPNYHGENANCLFCESPCECSGGTRLRGCYPSRNETQAVSLLVCPFKSACNPDNVDTFTCKKGYKGRLCSECDDGYHQQGRKCSECPYYATAVILTFYPLALIMFLWYLITTPPKSTGVIKIFLFHLQTLSILSSTILDLGTGMNSFVDTAFVSASLMLPGLNCIVGDISTFSSISVYLLRVPAMMFGGLVFVGILPSKFKSKVIFITAFSIHAIYYGVSRNVFGSLGCSLHDPGQEAWFLNMYPWVQCRPMSDEYGNIISLSIPFLILFVLGTPLWTYLLLTKLKQKYKDDDIQERFGFLYLPYRSECHLWECVVLLRRIFFSMVITVVPYSSTTLLFFLLYVIIQVRRLPHYPQQRSCLFLSFSFNLMTLSA
eukprot:TRINITY_DN9591_c0_g2_i2.p1 TRINITY_DN9591_c0_g2~~TRINITY_DN9591_c0_g2_i2.p1  ORF type:complete len:1451 (+),score=231.42 TRINITY_DN9591_c0_g2_i2:74-4426(+)